jgi:hypothetical protein
VAGSTTTPISIRSILEDWFHCSQRYIGSDLQYKESDKERDGVSLLLLFLFLFLMFLDMMNLYLIENCVKKTDKTQAVFKWKCQAKPHHAHSFCTDCYIRNNLLSGSQAKDDLEYFVWSTGAFPCQVECKTLLGREQMMTIKLFSSFDEAWFAIQSEPVELFMNRIWSSLKAAWSKPHRVTSAPSWPLSYV